MIRPPILAKLVFACALALAPIPAWAQSFTAGVAAYEQGDYARALAEWRPLAEHGDAVAQFNLGLMYQDGLGVLQDDAEAARWYRLAAEQGNSVAQVNLVFPT